ncbi:hypothetical protein MD484_g6374, partial [Candolleomyces efflorescens]
MADEAAADIRPYTLHQFCQRAQELYEADHIEEFIRFVLCGTHNGHQASIDVDGARVLPGEAHTLLLSRDFDSILGLDDQIRVRGKPITISMVAKYEDTLKKNVHIDHSYVDSEGVEQSYPLHRIPNLALGKWEVHNLIRVLFPDLCTPDRQSFHLSREEQAAFYEKGLLPTMQALLQHRGGDIPPTLDAEFFRARLTSGKLSFTTRVLPDWQVPLFADTLRANLAANGVEWGRNLVFLHQVRGMKNATHHSVVDPENGEAALDEFLDGIGLRLDTIKEWGDWWVDVGAEISSSEGECLAWRTDKHSDLVRLVVQTSEANARRITSLGSSKYYRDPASHLVAASGFRITPGVRAEGPFEVAYIQAYLTDKGLTYSLDNGRVSKSITPAQLVQGKGEQYISELYEVYRQASSQNFSTARVEARVPIHHASRVLINADMRCLAECLLKFPKIVWWSLKSWRALGCKVVNQWQVEGSGDLRLENSALYLTAGIAWLLNGIHATPDTGSASRELMNLILPRTRRRDVERADLPFPISVRQTDDDILMFQEEEEDEEESEIVTEAAS